MEGKTHRLFVALEPPDAVRRRIGARAAALRQAAGRHAEDVRWVPVENLHLTVQFLGAVPEQRVESVADGVRAAAAASRPLALEVKGAGGFPNARRPRVIWLGLEGDVEAARALVADVGRRLAPLGFAPEARPWAAHLTLGRARDPRGAPGLGGALVARAQEDGIPWRAGELVLVESHLSPKGPRYEPIVQAALGA
ncbi:RNA 2',3'-cyclic phosphodiesterase [Anaeromyxobacter sp. Fw109-5]|uniref:RNA 2',3'-cyclic phosphodiesterase n=1 Tax=Anaeromyxobacter sp. (strain Fw109-5) TaxID=404589 RepID=UPI000158A7EB|nr:RNA 2',3'-cyclic phosphodiesterase [Anaeromyxobacter sp. Fw109-5]ABS24676.1 2'-5' RNA ligase [Anaeromyxobacter sp. Fw109-5]